MTYASTLPIDLIEPAPPAQDGADRMSMEDTIPLRCVQSRMARPPIVQLPPSPSALNRQLQKQCQELQLMVAGVRRCALEQANREQMYRNLPGPPSWQRLQAAQATWQRQWTDLMDRLDEVQTRLPCTAGAPRDQETVQEAHRLIESIRTWALGFRIDADVGLDLEAVHDGAAIPWRRAAGITGACQ